MITYKESEYNGKTNSYIYKDNNLVAYNQNGKFFLFDCKLTIEELEQVYKLLLL